MVFRRIVPLAIALPMVAANSWADNMSTYGIIDGAQSAHLITSPVSGNAVVFGEGYNTEAYRAMYSGASLAPWHYGYSIAAPRQFIDAAAVPQSGYEVRPYNVYTIAIRGAGPYTFMVSDPAHDHNYVRTGSNAPTIDLMAALYAKSGFVTSAFNSEDTLQNLVVLSDDNSVYGAANPYPLFYQNESATDCVTLSLVYFPWSSIQTPAQVNIFASGMGQVVHSCGDLSLKSSLEVTDNKLGKHAADVIDAHHNLFSLFGGLTSDQQRSNAVNQTLPVMAGGSLLATQSIMSILNRIVQSRMDFNRGIASGDSFAGDSFMWMKPFGSWASQGDSNGIAGYKAATYGTAFGIDRPLSQRLNVGAAFSYAHAGIDGNSAITPQSTGVDVYQLAGYGSYQLSERTNLVFQADIGRNRTNSQRVIGLTSSVAAASYDSTSLHAGVGVGRLYYLSEDMSFTPSVRVDYTRIRDDSYAETGAGLLSLHVRGRSADQLVVGTEGKFSRKLGERTTLNASLGAGYDVLNQRAAITAAYAGAADAAFVTYGLKPSAWLARGGLGMVYRTRTGMELTGRYDVEHRESFVNQTASVKLRWAF